MLGRFFRATVYSLRVYGGPTAVLRAALLALKESGVSGVVDAITFAMRHSGRASIRRAPRYRKVQTVQKWLEPLVNEAAAIEPKILEIHFSKRLADPIYFHSPNDLSETVKSILEVNANEDVTHIILGKIDSTDHIASTLRQGPKSVLQIPSSGKMKKGKQANQGFRVVYNEADLPLEVFASAIFHVITTIQPSVLFIGELDEGLEMAIGNLNLIKQFSEVRSL